MAKHNTTISQERLKEVLNYNPETGIFTWKVRTGRRVKKGDVAGCLEKSKGYMKISIDSTLYYAHRLAWLYVYGEWPVEVDHVNGKKNDNRICNLRECTHTENLQNRQRANNNNGTRFLGVSEIPCGFMSRINVGGKTIHLGSYATPEEAHEAYIKAKRKLHPACTI